MVLSSNLIKGLLGGQTFLNEEVATWPSNPLYQLARKRVATLCVTNDVPKHGIALVKRFLNQWTKSEKQTLPPEDSPTPHTGGAEKDKGAAEDQGGQEHLR